jgi:diguanylate cyclase (GGDEF)-like protein
MTPNKINGTDTEFAPAERLSQEEVLRQHNDWVHQEQVTLVSNAVPNLLLILNKQRQIVYSNKHFRNLAEIPDDLSYIGKRPGELLQCVHAFESPGGCGTSRFCKTCGAILTVLTAFSGREDSEVCTITRRHELPELNLRVWTSPVTLKGEKYIIFTLMDITLELENTKLLDQVQNLAVRDPLTAIFNRRAFFDTASREITRSIRYHNPFSVVMIDLDDLKEINDSHSHQAGDAALKGVVDLVNPWLRDMDVFARYGGDEFVILLPETGLCGGQKVANRIMELADGSGVVFEGIKIPIRVSAGVAEFQFGEDENIESVIKRADSHLYKTKAERKKRLAL